MRRARFIRVSNCTSAVEISLFWKCCSMSAFAQFCSDNENEMISFDRLPVDLAREFAFRNQLIRQRHLILLWEKSLAFGMQPWKQERAPLGHVFNSTQTRWNLVCPTPPAKFHAQPFRASVLAHAETPKKPPRFQWPQACKPIEVELSLTIGDRSCP